jgi:hypothetical protein
MTTPLDRTGADMLMMLDEMKADLAKPGTGGKA